MKFAHINESVLAYSATGPTTAPPLLFINALGTDYRIWDDVAPAFGGRYRIIRSDKRGHGLSDAPPGDYTIGLLATDVAGLLDYLGLSTAVLIGVSIGGMIALDFASRWPERVHGLVLCDTAARLGDAAFWQTRIDAVNAQGLAAMADSILGRWFAPDFRSRRPADYAGFRNLFLRNPIHGYTAACAALRDADLSESVVNIMAPACVLCGAEDSATPPDLVRGLAEALPDGRFHLIEGAGHTPSVEQPAATAATITAFLDEIGY